MRNRIFSFLAGGLLLLSAGFVTDSRAEDDDKSFKLGGSLRGRYEWMKFRNDATGSGDIKDTRGRFIYRFRLDGKAKLNPKAGAYFRLVTGNDSRSGNTTLGSNVDFAPDVLSIRHAALVYTPLANDKGKWNLDFGRVKNPFMWKGGGKDKMMWDSDIAFSGVSSVYGRKMGDNLKFFANTGYYVIDENKSGDHDPFLAPLQAGLRFTGDNLKAGVRGTFYYMGELDDEFVKRGAYAKPREDMTDPASEPIDTATSSGGNIEDGLTGDPNGGIIRVVEAQAYVGLELGSFPVTAFGGYSNNTSATASVMFDGVGANGTAYNLGLEAGSKKKILAGVAGYHIEANAFPSQFIDSDILDGYTNREGVLVYLARKVMKNTEFNLQFFVSDAIESFEDHEDLDLSVANSKRTRLQVDMIYKF
ncbi:MAG: putative porin [Candidatus Krumholzibacteriota bacterium]